MGGCWDYVLSNLLDTGRRILSRRAAEGLHAAMAIQTFLSSCALVTQRV